MRLTDDEIRRAEPRERDYKINDGKGLYLHVTTAGARIWRYRYKITGVERLLTVGHYPKISLADARSARELARQKVKEGIDPSAAKQEAKREAAAAADPAVWADRIAASVATYRKKRAEASKQAEVLADMLARDLPPDLLAELAQVLQRRAGRST